MEVNVKEKTEEKILVLYEASSHCAPGSKEESEIIAQIEKLLRQLNEDEKINLEAAAQYDKLQQEKLIAEEKAKAESKNQLIGYCLKGVELSLVLAQLYCYGKWLKDGFAFEKDGIITSSWMRNLMSKIHPTKK